MTGLAEELEQETRRAFRRNCVLCAFLAEQSAPVAAEWREQLARPTIAISNGAVSRVLLAHGVKLGPSAVRTHRMNHRD